MKTKTDIYETVTNTIIEVLENGLTGKLEMPWHGVTALPQNARTENNYNGINIPLLWTYQMKKEYQSGIWATYKQWQDLGAQVKKGEKGAPVVFWKSIEVEPSDDNEEAESRMFARYSSVFNVAQVEGYEAVTESFEPNDIQAIAAADNLLDSSGIEIRYGEGGAYYSATGDYINLPRPEFFKETDDSSATENFYSTAFHEMTHATGAKHRLDRDMNHKFASKDYAFEELIAELGAAMLCTSAGVTPAPREDHVLYIQNWLKALKNDKKFIFAASSQAQKAADYLHSFTKED